MEVTSDMEPENEEMRKLKNTSPNIRWVGEINPRIIVYRVGIEVEDSGAAALFKE